MARLIHNRSSRGERKKEKKKKGKGKNKNVAFLVFLLAPDAARGASAAWVCEIK